MQVDLDLQKFSVAGIKKLPRKVSEFLVEQNFVLDGRFICAPLRIRDHSEFRKIKKSKDRSWTFVINGRMLRPA